MNMFCRCVQPHIRAKFFQVFDTSMRKRLHDRLLYVVCSQNWESMGPHYWIKQIVELMMATADQVGSLSCLELSCQLETWPTTNDLNQQPSPEKGFLS